MGQIIILDENTANKIAAGEVVERPASVIKELIENSIDAGADRINIDIKNGGISLIKVSDNGSGMEEDDVEIAFERHATSKIRKPDDLEAISTLGFRGEALASIAAVSNVQLTTRTKDKAYGMNIEITGGAVKDVKQTGCPVGTTITVKELFFNTPARYKFLKKDSTEAGYISEIVGRVALGHPSISFRLGSGNSAELHTPGNGDLKSVIFSVYGKETAGSLLEVSYRDEYASIKGYVGKPELSRSNRNHQSLYINGRYVKSRLISNAVEEAYKTFLMKDKFPFFVLKLELNPALVDVNVHPTKMEVRFSNEQEIYRCFYNAVNSTLLNKTTIRSPFQQFSDIPAIKVDRPKPEIIYRQPDFNTFTQVVREETVVPVQQEIKVEKVSCEPVEREVPELVQKPVFSPIAALPETENKEAISKDANIVGQLFSTYILLQQGDELIIVDQHAAHERIMYERLIRKYEEQESLSQLLAVPVTVELTKTELSFALERQDFFEKIGFKYESFGNNSLVLREMPYLNTAAECKETFVAMLDMAMAGDRKNISVIADEIIYTIACKAAVKANKQLDEKEIRKLLEELAVVDNPFSCPHGRPTAIRITKRDIEKMFKRIV